MSIATVHITNYVEQLTSNWCCLSNPTNLLVKFPELALQMSGHHFASNYCQAFVNCLISACQMIITSVNRAWQINHTNQINRSMQIRWPINWDQSVSISINRTFSFFLLIRDWSVIHPINLIHLTNSINLLSTFILWLYAQHLKATSIHLHSSSHLCSKPLKQTCFSLS